MLATTSMTEKLCILLAFCLAVSASSYPLPNPMQAAEGGLDTTFGNGGTVTTDFLGESDIAFAVAIQRDGRIIAAGKALSDDIYFASNFGLVRYNTDGSLDPSFGSGGKVVTDFFGDQDEARALAIQPDGKIVAAGLARRGAPGFFGLARYDSDGSLDSTFGVDGKVISDFSGDARALAIQPDGKLIAAGSIYPSNLSADFCLARFNTDGSLDLTFGSGGKISADFGGFDRGKGLALQPDGRIVVAGVNYGRGGHVDFALARYNSDGSLDPTFGEGGKVTTDFLGDDDFLADIILQPDGRIIAAGETNIGDDFFIALARYNTDGSLDKTFGDGGRVRADFRGKSAQASSLALQADGRIVVAGPAFDGASAGFGLTRFNSDGASVPPVSSPQFLRGAARPMQWRCRAMAK